MKERDLFDIKYQEDLSGEVKIRLADQIQDD